jgi:hypothetical protein
MPDRNGDANDEEEPLTQSQTVKDPWNGWSEGNLLKYGSLGLVIVQNSSHVLLLRYSRTAGGECEGYVVRRSALLIACHFATHRVTHKPWCRPCWQR